MTQFTRLFGLCAALIALTVAAGPSVNAQEKKEKDKETPKKTTQPTKAAPGFIEINEGKDGKFRFFVRDGEGKLLAMSGPAAYATKEDAQKGLDALKAILPTAKVTAGKKTEKE